MIKSKILFIFAFFAWSLVPSFAGQEVSVAMTERGCSEIDIRDFQTELADHFSTPFDQGDLGWCYAFVASDLLSAAVGKPLSPIHIASLHNKKMRDNLFYRTGHEIKDFFERATREKKNDFYTGGNVALAIRASRKNQNVCVDEPFKFSKYKLAIQRLEEIKGFEREHWPLMAEFNLGKIQFDFPNVSLSPEELTKDINDILPQVIGQACLEKANIEEYKVWEMSKPRIEHGLRSMDAHVKRTKEFYGTLNEILSSGHPVGLYYHSASVKKKKGQFHVSAVVGRRWKNNSCQYKIRNSWGKSCGQYKTGAIVECDKEEGSFWVTFEKLHDMAKKLVFIKPKSD